ncbi:uncharacterized protein A1O9_05260 [Exophiala aquamarina CBS 119918]|uniref:Major facilitator superfamily (MFS) profile domain-containing protein n=1 Tax=Exophiala aquamarina CBS 119918 TaxID=1182545 RepID=A0A072PDI6_9EURO|nr:uncharacterized protein A1O9_05260 [Exophiala aquamarina CBS 119918]KEF57343.1 hypothetical protein A1O9_05260 [Exophiala aquamarina CBS 119918]
MMRAESSRGYCSLDRPMIHEIPLSVASLEIPCTISTNTRNVQTWHLWRKYLALFASCFFVFLSNYVTLGISPILLNVVQEYNIDFTKAGYLISFQILSLGLGNLFWIPVAAKYGKRPVLILASCLFFVCSVWSAVAKTYGSQFGARFIQGFAASCSEALGPAVVADLFFVHERGLWMGAYILMFTVGSSCGGIFAGLIANASPNWRMVLWANSILAGVLFLTMCLFASETNFERPPENEMGEGLEPSELPAIRARANSSWLKSLSLTGWYDSSQSLWWLWWRPLLTLQYPANIWATLVYGVTLAWIVLQSTANGVIFPIQYNFSPLAVGNIACAYLVASLIGSAAGGPVSDWTIKFFTKRRGGYFEPEFRLWCLIPAYLFGPLGLLLYGFGIENNLPPMVPIVGTAITWGVLCAVSTIAVTYVVDCYRPLAGETMTALTAAKNTFAFALSFAVFPWFLRDGYAKVSLALTRSHCPN